MTKNWYESLDAKGRRPFKLAVRKVMKTAGFIGSNQNLDSFADAFIKSDFGLRVQKTGSWSDSLGLKDRVLEFNDTPAGNITKYGGKIAGKDTETQTTPESFPEEDVYDKNVHSMDYYDAARIRQTGFLERMKKRQRVAGEGMGTAFKNTFSEGISARVKMMKRLSDPMNWLKSIPGIGGNLAMEYGNRMGRSQSDMNYFGGVKKKRILTAADIPSNNNMMGSDPKSAEVLTEMFEFMKTSRTEDKQLLETTDNYNRLNENIREDNHKEVIKALMTITSGKRKADKKITTEAKKQKSAEEAKNKSKAKKSVIRKQIESKAKKSVMQGEGMSTILKGAGEVATTASKYAAPVVAAVGLGAAIGSAEAGTAGYNAANRGTFKDPVSGQEKIMPVLGKVDLANMTLGEIQKRQAIKFGAGDEQKLFAVGKYQVIPDTLKGAMAALKLSPTEKFTPELQERIYKEYLITIKQPDISAYLNSPVEDPILLRKAIKAASDEWASIADPDIPGGITSHYGHGNKASISVDQMAAILMKQRQENLSLPATEIVPPTLISPAKPDVEKVSTENADLWKSVKASRKTIVNYYGQNTSAIAQKSIMFNSGTAKREPHPITGIN